MNQFAKIAVICFVLFVTFAPMAAFAADDAGGASKASYGLAAAAIGAGLVIFGGAYGIGRIGSAAVESMARQPELAGGIQTAMIIAAALIEGVTFFALIICILCIFM